MKREYEALKMNEAESIKDFMTKMMKVVNQIRSDCKIVDKLLVVLLERFDPRFLHLKSQRISPR